MYKNRTLTHAHLIGTSQLLSLQWKYLSPCLGAAFDSSPYAGNLLRIGKMMGPKETSTSLSSPSKLATSLFFQPSRYLPARVTRTRSMAACHLTPRRIGVIMGCGALFDGHESPITNMANLNEILRLEGIRSNYVDDEWTGVSLKRWKDLISSPSCTLSRALWLSVLWQVSNDKTCLLKFLLAIEEISRQSILRNDEYGNALRYDPIAQSEWANAKFEPHDLSSNNVEIAWEVLTSQMPSEDPELWSRSLEVICASRAIQHVDKPVIPPGKYGFDGGEPKSDCVEVAVRELFDLILWDDVSGSFDLTRLPSTASQDLVDLYKLKQDGKRWFEVLSDLPGCDYLMTSPNGKHYELTPTLGNIAEVSRFLLYGEGERSESLEAFGNSIRKNLNQNLSIVSRLSRHPSILGEDIVIQEVASLYIAGSRNSIEMRLDKAHAICTVTHLRQRHAALAPKIVQKMLESASKDSAPILHILALSSQGDIGLTHCGPSKTIHDLLLNILSIPFGPDRRDLLHVIGTPDLERRKRDFNLALNEYHVVLKKALMEVCRFECETFVKIQLLKWLLGESQNIMESDHLDNWKAKYDPGIESMVLGLPSKVLQDPSLQTAISSSWTIRGKLVLILIKLQLGTIPNLQSLMELSTGELFSLILLIVQKPFTSKKGDSSYECVNIP